MPPKRTASKAASKKTAGPNIKDLATQMNLPLKQGKLVVSRDQFFVNIDGQKTAVPALAVTDAAQLKRLADKDVAVLVSKRSIVAIGGATWKPPIIVCYIPAPDIIRRMEPEFRQMLIKTYQDAGVINADQAEKLQAQRG